MIPTRASRIMDLAFKDPNVKKISGKATKMLSFVRNCYTMKKFRLLLLLLVTLLSISCEKDPNPDGFQEEVRFDISSRILEGKGIAAIDFDMDGNAVIGSEKTIYIQTGKELKSIETGFRIIDLAVANDNSIWIGTDGGGLGHLEADNITWYTKANSGLPRDLIMNVEVAPDGTVWFASCAHLLGGLGSYNGSQFRFYTPENSPINQNIIEDIEISSDGTVYIATTGTVGSTNIYRFHNKTWECLGNEEGTFYWTMSFTISSGGNIYLVEDFSLSSSMRENRIYRYGSGKWVIVDPGDNQVLSFFNNIKTDKRDYCWVTSINDNGPGLLVFDGNEWHRSPDGLIPDATLITSIEADKENNIWIGTYSDGIFILNQ